MTDSLRDIVSTAPNTHLAHFVVIARQPHYEDGVCLADAHLGPLGHGAVTLVQHHAVDVLLLAQPAEQPELIHTADIQERDPQVITHLKLQTGQIIH